jgi:hypothetical protein
MLTIKASFTTSLAAGCVDYSPYKDHFVHIYYSGSNKFSVSLQQHNSAGDETILPFPETWDSVQASRYTYMSGNHIYIPVSHFNIDLRRVTGLAIESWYTNETTYLYKVELLPSYQVPLSMHLVDKLDSGTLRVSCTQPNLIAFGIDDGEPGLLQETLQIIKDEKIPVTIFVQGSALQLSEDDGNFTAAYREMYVAGHQIGLHTMTHPHMESVKTEEEIALEITRNIDIVSDKLRVKTKYFRPPYGTVGSRTRQAVAYNMPGAEIIM